MNFDINKFHECLNAENLSKEQIDWMELMYITYPDQIEQYFKDNFNGIHKDNENNNDINDIAGTFEASESPKDATKIAGPDADRIRLSLLNYTDKYIGSEETRQSGQTGSNEIFKEKQADGRAALVGASERRDGQDNVHNLSNAGAPGNRRSIVNRFFRAAAILILLMGSAFILKFYVFKSTASQNSAELATGTVPQDRKYEFYNFRGIPTGLTLPDGSKVELMAKSLITWPADFGVSRKQVYLKGEALFTVNRDPQKDFSVMTPELEIKDLGTIFLVKNSKEALNVKLLKGKVMLLSKDKNLVMAPITLQPGEVFELRKASGLFTLNNRRLNAAPAQKIKPATVRQQPQAAASRQLNYKNESLVKVLREVAHKYNKQIIFEDDVLKGKSFTGDLSNIHDLEQVLNILCFTNGLKYEIKDDSISIH